MRISTHVLDTAAGRPAAGVGLALYRVGEGAPLVETLTNADGRTDAPLATDAPPGLYEIVFAIGAYYEAQGEKTFLDAVSVRFRAGEGHYHVPLLVTPWSYATYRGS